MHRNVRVLAMLTTGAIALAACSSQSGQEGGDGTDGKRVTITYGLWDDSFRPGYEKALAKFHETNPNVDVKFVVTPFNDYDTKLQASVASKTAPDVFWLQDSFKLYATNGALTNLNDKIASSKVDLSGFPQQSLDAYKVDGKQYGLPWTTITVGLWYNKSLFDAAGVAYPDSKWTWDDLSNAAKKLTNKPKGIYGMAAPVSGQEGYYNTIYQAGGSVINSDGTKSEFGSPSTLEGLKYWTSFISDGTSPTVAQMTDTSPSQLFGSGKLAMFYGGSWNAGTLAKSPVAKDIDVAPLPQGRSNTVAFTSAVNAIAASSKHQEAAWKWMQFLASADAQNIQAASGVVAPASTKAREAWVSSLPYNVAIFMDQVANAKPLPTSINTFAWKNQETTILTPAFEGKESVEEAASKMAAAMDTALAAEKSR